MILLLIRTTLLTFILIAGISECQFAKAQTNGSGQPLKTTAQRVLERGWWPTKSPAARDGLVGSSACEVCHQRIAFTQFETPMAHAATKAPEITVLRSSPKLSFATPPYQTTITTDASRSQYLVSGNGDSLVGEIRWSVGAGRKGQTFLVQYLGNLFESQLSYFASVKALDITPEHPRTPPEFLERAFGAPLSDSAAQQCFSCHTTASTIGKHFDPDHATPGVTCEACHGPGRSHVKDMQAGEITQGLTAILNPSSFAPTQIVDFCGACHRTSVDVAAAKDLTPLNVRFQPYRLSKSRCWSKPDARITCVACHNPHEPLVHNAEFYDEKCLACHSDKPAEANEKSGEPLLPQHATTCPVSTNQCVSCHMPKYEDSQFHGSFTDHNIRIVHPGDPYPL